MTVSQHLQTNSEHVSLSKRLTNLFLHQCNKNFLGKRDCYKYELAVKEYADLFSLTKLPFGSYELKGQSVYFINETQLNEKQKEAFRYLKCIKTGLGGIYSLPVGKIVQMQQVREPLFEVHQRDHDEN